MNEEMDESLQKTKSISEAVLLDEIERIIRMSDKPYGYQHLSTIGQGLRDTFPDYDPEHYGYKNLRMLVEAHPERFKISHRGRAQFWVRLSTEPKRKEGYAVSDTKKVASPKPKPRLMNAKEFDRLYEWLSSPKGVNLRFNPAYPDDIDGIITSCDGTLRKTRLWLKRRDFLALKANVKLIKQLGGHCDCEVLFNVVEHWSHD